MKRFALLLLAGLLAACGDDGGGSSVDRSDASSDFTVQVPDGYHELASGRGQGTVEWGDDSSANTGPFVVLGGEDDPTHQLTTLELGGFEGMQGGLRQAAGAYPNAPSEDLDLDGRPALTVSTGTFASVAAERGDDLAVVARSTVFGTDDLVDLIQRAELPDGDRPTQPPAVDPPSGWTLLGSASTDLTMALETFANDGFVAGPASAHARAWESGTSDNTLVVETVPGTAGDVEAALGYALITGGIVADEVERFELDGRGAVWVANESDAILATTTDWGDLLVLSWSANGVDAQPADRAGLEAIAVSAEQA